MGFLELSLKKKKEREREGGKLHNQRDLPTETSELPVELRPLGGSTLGSDPGPSEAPQHSTLVVHARAPGPLFPFVSGTPFVLLHVPPRHSQRSIFAT